VNRGGRRRRERERAERRLACRDGRSGGGVSRGRT
jgi:hypothetical protein